MEKLPMGLYHIPTPLVVMDSHYVLSWKSAL